MCKALPSPCATLSSPPFIVYPGKSQACDIGFISLRNIFIYLLKSEMDEPTASSDFLPVVESVDNSRNIWNHGGNNEWLSRVIPPRELDESDGVEINYTENSVVVDVIESLLESSSPSRDNSISPNPTGSPLHMSPSNDLNELIVISDPDMLEDIVISSSSKESVSANSSDRGEDETYSLSLLDTSSSGRRSKTPPPTPTHIPTSVEKYIDPPIPPGSGYHLHRHRAQSLQDTMRSSTERLKFEFGKIQRRIDDVEVFLQIDHVKNVDWTKQHQRRGGVIVYFVHRNEIVFGMGSDSVYKEITDFGGGNEEFDDDSIDTALREFGEETLCVYGNISRNDVSECMVLYDQNMMIMFLPLKFDPNQITKNFNERVLTQDNPEINELIWLSRRNFIDIVMGHSTGVAEVAEVASGSSAGNLSDDSNNLFQINNHSSRRMYERVSTFLRNAFACFGDFTERL